MNTYTEKISEAVKHGSEGELISGHGEECDNETAEHDLRGEDSIPSRWETVRPHRAANQSCAAAGSATNLNKEQQNPLLGNLSQRLLEMPIDVLCEISIHFEPLDLLYLARTTRGLNELLMSRVSKPIWRMSRSYYSGLPDCPVDLSEPAYARLLFETNCCHECLSSNQTKVYYFLRARLCYACCTSGIIMRGSQFFRAIPDLTEELLECVPCHSFQWYGTRPLRLEEFYNVRVQAMVAKFRAAVPNDIPDGEAQLLKTEFYRTNKITMSEVVKHAVDVEQWLVTYRQIKDAEAQDAATKRKSGFRTKLVELGYSSDDFPGDWDTEWDEIMEHPEDSTPQHWDTVRPILEACIQRETERREAEARDKRKADREAEVSRCVASQDMPPWMNLADVLLLPTVEGMVVGDDYGQPITRETWEVARHQIEQEMDDYVYAVREQLIGLVIASRHPVALGIDGPRSQSLARTTLSRPLPTQNDHDHDIDHALLLSPSTFFECRCCSGPLLRYPALLGHNKYWPTKRFVKHYVTCNAAATAIAGSLISTIQGIQNKNVDTLTEGFQCLRCDETAREPMTWIGLVQHFVTKQQQYGQSYLRRHVSFSTTVALHNDHTLKDASFPAAVVLKGEEASEHEHKGKMPNAVDGNI